MNFNALVLAVLPAMLTACSSGSSPGACVGATLCVDDKDCQSGSRCNTALSPPACQTLYCGPINSACASDFFCASQICASKKCIDPNSTPPLGNGLPSVIHWINLSDAGVTGSIAFSDNPLNTCAALQARMEYPNGALLYISPPYTDGRVANWITDAQARSGLGGAGTAYFLNDQLSGLDLRKHTGTITLVHVPVIGGNQNWVVTLESDDGGVRGTFTAPPVCP